MPNTMIQEPQKTDSDYSLVDILAILLRGRMLWISFAIAGAIFAAAYAWITFYPPPPPPPPAFWTGTAKVYVLDPYQSKAGALMAELAGSTACLRYIDNAVVDPASLEDYLKKTKVSYNSASEHIIFSAATETADEAKTLVALGQKLVEALYEASTQAGAYEQSSTDRKILQTLQFATFVNVGLSGEPIPETAVKVAPVKTLSSVLVKSAIKGFAAFLFLGLILTFMQASWKTLLADPESKKKLDDAITRK